jgi:HPt (histidine-containing phosphotransfer) domain-containing protein
MAAAAKATAATAAAATAIAATDTAATDTAATDTAATGTAATGTAATGTAATGTAATGTAATGTAVPAATAAAAEVAVLDRDVLQDIAAIGRPALLGSLIDLYLEHSRPLLETIQSAIQGREPEGLVDALHTLKSSTANLGGARLAELLRGCEALAQRRGAAAVPELARLPAAYDEFCEALIRERSALAA